MKDNPLVLVVDDECGDRFIIREALEQSGFDVVEAESGPEAMEAFDRLCPDLVLLDVFMPGMDGFEVCHRLREQPEGRLVPIVIITGTEDFEAIRTAYEAGATDFITKPINWLILTERIRYMLRANETARMLRRSRTLLQSAFDGISDPLYMMDSNLRVQVLNKASTVYFECSFSEAVGRACHEAFFSKRKICEDCQILDRDGGRNQRWTFERQGRMDPNKLEQVDVYTMQPFEEGTDGGMIVHIRDITKTKHLERELIQADKLASLGTLVSGVAHEINNPMGVITMNVPMLRDIWEQATGPVAEAYEQKPDFRVFNLEYPELQERISSLFAQVMDSTRRIKKIVGELKDFARQGTSDMNQRVDLNQSVETAISLTFNKIKRSTDRFSVSYAQSPIFVRGNAQKLEQVLINVLLNACEALQNNDQTLALRLETVLPETARVVVEDEGCGMARDQLGQIMDPFFTTKRDQGGTGLGLSVSLGIIEDHGGSIEFEAEPGAGTVCTISLPLDASGQEDGSAG